jgi:two-component system nitrogen regulation response regulator NtrX
VASDILIVDDEPDICELVAGILQDEGHGTRTARDSDEALAAVGAHRPNLVFLDIWLQGSQLDGLQLLDSLKQEHPELPIVIISGHGNIETASSAIKRGAYDFIEKPFKPTACYWWRNAPWKIRGSNSRRSDALPQSSSASCVTAGSGF